jgi:hypothetical protein
MKTIVFVFVALSLAGVLTVPVPRTLALTSKFCDELDIRDYALVSRGDSGEDDDVSSPDLAVVDHERAAKDRRNQLSRARRASESPETAKKRKVTETARKRRRLEELAAKDPEEAKRRKDRKASQTKATRDARLANPDTAGDCIARERQKEARYRASQRALAAQDPRVAESQRAHRAARKKRYSANKATHSLCTDPVGPSPQQAASPITQNVSPQHHVAGPQTVQQTHQVVQQTHQVEPDYEDYAHLCLNLLV